MADTENTTPALQPPTEDVQPNPGTQPGETRWRVRHMFSIDARNPRADQPGEPETVRALVNNDNVMILADQIGDLAEREERGEVYREIVPEP